MQDFSVHGGQGNVLGSVFLRIRKKMYYWTNPLNMGECSKKFALIIKNMKIIQKILEKMQNCHENFKFFRALWAKNKALYRGYYTSRVKHFDVRYLWFLLSNLFEFLWSFRKKSVIYFCSTCPGLHLNRGEGNYNCEVSRRAGHIYLAFPFLGYILDIFTVCGGLSPPPPRTRA